MRRKLQLLALLTALLGLLAGCGQTAADPAPTAESPAPTGETVTGTNLTVYCFQAGKADAFLLYTEQSAVLIDTGESGFGKTILNKLSELGIEKLDCLIVTHFDKDHVGGAKKILESVEVGAVLQSNCPKDSSAYNKYVAALAACGLQAQTVREELCFTLDGIVYTVNPPAQETYAKDASNNSSLIVSVTNGLSRLLFTGDAEEERLGEFLSGNPGHYDFLKIPYHGHWQYGLAALLQAVSPQIAVIPSSDDEPEDQMTLDTLAQYGVETYLTRTAPVVLVSDGVNLTAGYERQ